MVEIETSFRKVTEKDFDGKSESRFDLTRELEEDFHNAIFMVVKKFVENPDSDFEEKVISELNGDCPKDVETFSDMANIVHVLVSKVGMRKLSEYDVNICTCANGLHDGLRIDCNCKIHHQ